MILDKAVVEHSDESNESDEPSDKNDESSKMHPDVVKTLKEQRYKKGGQWEPPPEPRPSGNPQRRAQRLAEQILNDRADELPEEMRYVFKARKVWRDTGSRVRADLMAWYGGKCQVCMTTFPTGGNKPFFQAHNIIKSKKAGDWIDRGPNCLCLCATHAAQFEFGYPTVGLEAFVQQLQEQDLTDRRPYYEFNLCLAGELCTITFAYDHVHDFQILIQIDENLQELAAGSSAPVW